MPGAEIWMEEREKSGRQAIRV